MKAVKNWSEESAKKENVKPRINLIWFCIEGTKSKLFDEDIESMVQATKIWKSVPIIVVITKSYSQKEKEQNMEMVKNAFAKWENAQARLKAIIPIVAMPYEINEEIIVPQEGLSELIEKTNAILPEGIILAEKDLKNYILSRKNFYSQTYIVTATAAAAIVGAIPIPFSDALLLKRIEKSEINQLAKHYEVDKLEKHKRLLEMIIEEGTVGEAAKTIINGLKVIPGINIAASVLNAVIAGVLVATMGEASIYIFSQIYLGKKTVEDFEWAKKFINTKIADTIVIEANEIFKQISDKANKQEIIKGVMVFVQNIFNSVENYSN